MIKTMKSIWKYSFGQPESFTPVSVFKEKLDQSNENTLPTILDAPIRLEQIKFILTDRGCFLELPYDEKEQFYGLGLQLKSVNQNYKKKTLRVNSDPAADTGDSHAPVPFYVSTKGYGVFIDTARYLSFYFGTHVKSESSNRFDDNIKVSDNTKELYAVKTNQAEKHVVVDIPTARGIDIYIFGGPTISDAICRYNMFSGGGFLPPMWGLGIWYRTYADANKDSVIALTKEFRQEGIPCDVIGLEPGWQTHSYSCSYVWNEEQFPQKDKIISELGNNGFHINLWEHLFIHHSSPIYNALTPYAGDYRVWDGLVPDFSLNEAAQIFADYHKKEFVDKGISGFKFDECDNSDFIHSPWSYPENSEFPSGIDGEQMHSFMGMLYQKMMMSVFLQNNKRTFSAVRSSHAFAADMPFVLYSDLYDHKDFVRGIVTSGFSGLMWTPEVRQGHSVEELIRRIQSVIFSPMALINAWMIPNPPWKQIDEEKNKTGKFLPEYKDVERICKELFNLRMQLIPYLYTTYYTYEKTGFPPFRALVVDYPGDANTYWIDNQYMIGKDLMVAPMFEGEKERSVYLPAGTWFNYFTSEAFIGERFYTMQCPIEQILLFVKDNSLIPIAKPVQYITEDTVFEIQLNKYGKGNAETFLIEDDGVSYDYRNGGMNRITIVWNEGEKPIITRDGNFDKIRYQFNLS